MQFNEEKLKNILQNFRALEERMSDPSVSADPDKLRVLSRERSRTQPLADLIENWFSITKQMLEVSDQLMNEKDSEFKEVLLAEKKELEAKQNDLAEKLQIELLPKDPDSGKDVFVEIRAGTGGDEAALFARDMFRMYTRYLDSQGISYEVLDLTDTGINGLKEVVFQVKGEKAFDIMHHEAGTHRVQRIPATEANGRIHTSACTVAVIPEADEKEVNINPVDLRYDVFRASGSGGQHVNKTESAVRITHLPTGIAVACQEEKSQHKNKARAMQILMARLNEIQRQQNHEKASAEKKGQIGSGDRSEKIRTYNFPQNRLTDHRINYTEYNLDQIIEGKMDNLIQALNVAERERLVAESSI